MSNEELVSLFQKTRDNETLEQIIKENEGLVYYVMKRYRVEEIEKEDLFQEGNIGLLKAIDKFDCSLKYKFSTYAVFHIRASMSRYITQRIEKHLEVDSLNKTIGEEQDTELQELIKDDDVNIEELIKRKIQNEELEEVIKANCSELEQKVIHLYYYLNLTYKEVGKALDIGTVNKAMGIADRGLRNIRRSKWGIRESKRIREKQIDHKTRWINTQRYDSMGNGNSHSGFYSSVEDLVMQREKLRQSI